MSPNKDVAEACVHMQLVTHMESFPLSNEQADRSVEEMEKYAK